MNGRCFALLLWCGAGCASGPSADAVDALDAYRSALERRDLAAVYRASGPASRTALTEEEVAKFLRKNPRLYRETLARLDAPVVETTVVLELENGTRVRLVRDGAEWAVEEGGILVPRLDAPAEALRTFFFASAGHLGLLRQTIPDAFREKYASDASLGQHLYRLLPRITRAKEALGPIDPAGFVVRGGRARYPYGDGLEVVLIREEGTWRVLDLE